jgi:hypothetical protein
MSERGRLIIESSNLIVRPIAAAVTPAGGGRAPSAPLDRVGVK